ncbi:hypothetical protein EC973_009608 [Apophysomyces ossiformis]|uniref:Uncharacterized protein n=1 Tax=Apophysomyces ossiformis TaxID=679940 RepID=A0A8H7BR47_9FUNG|nr:hypothetical protein EC973_009608 [Apophysomyces ossiformis]
MDTNSSYRYQYDGNDKYLLFFARTNLKDWDFQHFEGYFNNPRNPPSRNTLVSSYRRCLNRIHDHPCTPESVKAKIKTLLGKVDTVDPSQAATSSTTYHVHQGDDSFTLINYGSNASIFNTKKGTHDTSTAQQRAEDDQCQSVLGKRCFDDRNEGKRPSEEDDNKTRKRQITKNAHANEAPIPVSKSEPQDKPERASEPECDSQSESAPESVPESTPPSNASNSASIPTWAIDDEDDFWEALEKHHIIECGYSIECKPHIPPELYQHLCLTKTPAIQFQDVKSYVSNYIKLAKDDNVMTYRSCTEQVFPYGGDVDVLETIFNYRMVWPCLDAVANCINEVRFYPGEIFLSAFPSSTSGSTTYKADGVLMGSSGIELVLLETSGPFGNQDKTRHARDHVKAAFGLTAMLKDIARRFPWGKFETFQKLKVYFVHARGEHINLWGLEMVSPSVFVLERLEKAQVPRYRLDAGLLLGLCDLFWKVKVGVSRTLNVIKDLRDEHDDYLVDATLGLATDDRESLVQVVRPTILKPAKGEGNSDDLPVSSLSAEMPVFRVKNME